MGVITKTSIVAAAIFLPYVAGAQGIGIPCDGGPGDACTFNDFVELIGNIIEFLFVLAIPVAVVFFLFAGARLVFSKGNPMQLQKAKQMLASAVIGLFFIMAAYAIVITILNVLLGDEYRSFVGKFFSL